MTSSAFMTGAMCDALDQTEDAQATSILAVLRNLRFADKLPSSYVSLLIHLHSPLILEVRFPYCRCHFLLPDPPVFQFGLYGRLGPCETAGAAFYPSFAPVVRSGSLKKEGRSA